jgi:hypothetical protein
MSIFDRISGLFSYRRRIFSLRKKYDRVRERTDKEKDATKRLTVLRILDQAEPTLTMLEEQNISRFERGRMMKTVEAYIEQAKSGLKKRQEMTRYDQRAYTRR